jgi:hypothetical protein
MKALRIVMMGLALLLVCGWTQAASRLKPGNPTKEEAMNAYLNAVLHGHINGVADVIDDDALFNIKRGNKVSVLLKADILKAFKANENVEQTCQSTKTVIQNDDSISIVKVDMKYPSFTRTDVITEQHAGNGWKITKVESSYN